MALLALVFACLLDSTSAIVYNYTSFFNPTVGCSLTVGPDGSIYVGLCSKHSRQLNSDLTAALISPPTLQS